MASVPDRRLQVNRAALDKWSIREQLCLASAIALSGDQNWIGVSRTLKQICGNNNNRPADWFSTKNCALQYGYLLENVETPKRKKRGSEGGARTSSPATVTETPIDLIVKRLTDERIQELREQVRKDQQEYAKIQRELKLLRSDDVSENQLQVMWKEIQEQKDAERVDEMKWENEMRERDQRKLEMQRNWRTGSPAVVPPPLSIPSPLTSTATSASTLSGESTDVIDMDVEDIIGTGKTQQQQTATSPLLSSLLKSPTTSSGGSIRAAAPTITTLLTSGSIPNTNQPAITLKSTIPPEKAAQLLTRPISGPPLDTLTIPATTVNQTVLSPSQSAPTLSLLLEKNKIAVKAQAAANKSSTEAKNVEENAESQTTVQSKTSDVATAENQAANADSDEPDPNEEQQLLEVFENIGNIAELDIDVSAVIDEEVDFLKGVDDEEPATLEEVNDAKDGIVDEPLDAEPSTSTSEPAPEADTKEIETVEEKVEIKDEGEVKVGHKDGALKAETTSSDDSNDNIPLSSVASSLEGKEKRSATPKDETVTTTATVSADNPVEAPSETESKDLLKEETKASTIAIKEESPEDNENDTKVERISIEIVEDTNDSKWKKEDRNEEDIEMITDASLKNETSDGVETAEVSKTDDVEMISDSNDAINAALVDESDVPIDDKKPLKTEKIEDTEGDEKPKNKIEDTGDEKDDDNLEKVIKTNNEPEADESIDFVETIRDQDESTAEVFVERPSSAQTQENSASECESTIAALPPPSLISTADTDEDSSTTDVSISTTKREERSHAGSRAHHHNQQQHKPSSPPSAHTRKSSSYDSHTSNAGDHETSSTVARPSRRSLLNIYNLVLNNKNCVVLQRALAEESKTKRSKYCKRQIEFQTIKKSIENGTIRTMSELQRDFMLIITNVLILPDNSAAHAAALALRQDMRGIREFTPNASEIEESKPSEKETKDIKPSTSKTVRTGSRKSQRFTL